MILQFAHVAFLDKYSPIMTLVASATEANLRSLRSFSKSLNISSVIATVTFFIAIWTVPAIDYCGKLYKPIAMYGYSG